MDTRTTTVDTSAGFYGQGFGIRAVRLGLQAAQKLWPGLAVRAALRLFATPLPPKWLHRGMDGQAGWRSEHWPFEHADLTLHAQASAPPGPVALLVHGWGGHARQLLPLAEVLARQGWRPLLLEMPAHGRSAGSTSSLPQFARAIDDAVGRLRARGQKVGLLVAHSLGATAAVHAASRGVAVERLVLLAPAASPRKYTRYFAQVFGLSEATRAAMQQRLEQDEGVLMRDFEPPAVAPRIRVPTLVVHDAGDRINPFADGQAFAHAIQGAQLLATESLGHRRILKDARVLDHVARFAAL
jgi:pimeloyl-ACP methyl ester carboxylesterase